MGIFDDIGNFFTDTYNDISTFVDRYVPEEVLITVAAIGGAALIATGVGAVVGFGTLVSAASTAATYAAIASEAYTAVSLGAGAIGLSDYIPTEFELGLKAAGAAVEFYSDAFDRKKQNRDKKDYEEALLAKKPQKEDYHSSQRTSGDNNSIPKIDAQSTAVPWEDIYAPGSKPSNSLPELTANANTYMNTSLDSASGIPMFGSYFDPMQEYQSEFLGADYKPPTIHDGAGAPQQDIPKKFITKPPVPISHPSSGKRPPVPKPAKNPPGTTDPNLPPPGSVDTAPTLGDIAGTKNPGEALRNSKNNNDQTGKWNTAPTLGDIAGTKNPEEALRNSKKNNDQTGKWSTPPLMGDLAGTGPESFRGMNNKRPATGGGRPSKKPKK